MVKLRYYAPLSHEVPKAYRNKVRVFGMGYKNAVALTKILETEEADYLIIFGTAGGLEPNKKVGNCFLISLLKERETHIPIPIPKGLKDFPQASLMTVSKIASTKEAKEKLYQETPADLVDMEMNQIWAHLSPELQMKTIFVRGVVDEVHHSIIFLEKPLHLFSPQGLVDLKRLYLNFKTYRSSMTQFLDQLESVLARRVID